MNSGIEGNSYGAVISPTRISYKVGQGLYQVVGDAILIGTNDDEVNYGSTQRSTDLILQVPSMYNNGVYIGSGALSLQVPDGTSKGGNVRGSGAVDFQTVRSSAQGPDKVASGQNSFIAAGTNNKSSGNSSFSSGYNSSAIGNNSFCVGEQSSASGATSICLGTQSAASGNYSVTIGANSTSSGNYSMSSGQGTTASASWSTAMGYNSNASSQYAVAMGFGPAASGTSSVALGEYTIASGYGALAIGQNNNSNGMFSMALGARSYTNGISQKFVIGTNYKDIVGGFQSGILSVAAETTDATATVLKSGLYNGTVGIINQCVLQNNNAIAFTIEVVAHNTSTGMAGRWEAKGLIKRGANASATALVGTPTVTLTNADNEAWIVSGAIAITADTTSGALAITVTGAASTTIRWVAKILTTEVV
jgi:hypothetical protein